MMNRLLLLFFAAMPLIANTDLAEEIEKLKLEEQRYELKNNIAQHKKDILQAERNILIANAIKGKTQPLGGSINIDEKAGQTVVEYVAYMSLEKQAIKIAKEINEHFKGKRNTKILIIDNNDYFTKSSSIIQMESQLNFFKTEYDSRVENTDKLLDITMKLFNDINDAIHTREGNGEKLVDAGLLYLPLISAGLSSIADIAGFFKTDYDIKGKTIEVDDFTLSILIEKGINKKIVEDVRISNFFNVSKDSKLLKDLNSILEGTYTIKQKNIHLSNLKKTLTEFIAKYKKIKDFKEYIKKSTDHIKSIENVYEKNKLFNAQFTNFNKSISTNVENEASLIYMALMREYIETQSFTHLLYSKVISFGGDLISTKKAFKSGSVSAYGGTIVIYTLTDLEGNIKLSEKHSGVHKWLVPIK